MKTRYRAILGEIARAAESCGRNPSDVCLVAVTKTVGVEAIREAYDLGMRVFGESRLQEALPKIEALPQDIEWHFIGKLQSNKARKAAEAFACIHTVENEGQLRAIEKADRPIDVLVEVNIAKEPQKTGIFPERVDEFWHVVSQYKHVRARGLMTIGPYLSDPEAMRPYFRALRQMNDRLGGSWLSMGMSSDYSVAIQEGATHVRIGTALFGNRPNVT